MIFLICLLLIWIFVLLFMDLFHFYAVFVMLFLVLVSLVIVFVVLIIAIVALTAILVSISSYSLPSISVYLIYLRFCIFSISLLKVSEDQEIFFLWLSNPIGHRNLHILFLSRHQKMLAQLKHHTQQIKYFFSD